MTELLLRRLRKLSIGIGLSMFWWQIGIVKDEELVEMISGQTLSREVMIAVGPLRFGCRWPLFYDYSAPPAKAGAESLDQDVGANVLM